MINFIVPCYIGIVLYSHLHCVHFIDLKRYFLFIWFNFVSLNLNHYKRKELDYITYSRICENTVKRESDSTFVPLFRLLIIVEMEIK